jgi:hypothetical protein
VYSINVIIYVAISEIKKNDFIFGVDIVIGNSDRKRGTVTVPRDFLPKAVSLIPLKSILTTFDANTSANTKPYAKRI